MTDLGAGGQPDARGGGGTADGCVRITGRTDKTQLSRSGGGGKAN